jgi:ligand-binding SRPBCC domain-containing protein
MVHQLEREQWVPAPLDRVFAFFSDAGNLDTITPRWVGFRIVTPRPIAMHVGAHLEYRLRLAGVPFGWRTRIVSWDPPAGFVDVQERGPYALWEHTHEFRPGEGGVWMRDLVRYALPLGPLGALAHRVAVRAALAAIFDYRFARIRELFGNPWPAARLHTEEERR